MLNNLFRPRPKIFIGSSTEGLSLAKAIEKSLASVAKLTLWSKGIFRPDKMPLDVLSEQVLKNDMAVLVASADDEIVIRGEVQHSMRDNVLFEFGLFTGAFGRQRTFLVLPNTEQFRIPSDITGVSHIIYEVSTGDDKKNEEFLGETCKNLTLAVNSTFESSRANKANYVADNMKRPGRRLLRFISWVRDELTQTQLENSEDFGEILAFKIQGLSSFLANEAETLNVKGEFDNLITTLVDAAQYFPSNELVRTYNYGHSLLSGHCYFDEYEVEKTLRDLSLMEASVPFGRYNRRWLDSRNGRLGTFYERGPTGYYGLSEKSREFAPTLFEWWRLGVVEAIAPLHRMSKKIKFWNDTYLKMVRESLESFEKRLYDNLSI